MRSTLIAATVAVGLVTGTTTATAAVNPEPPAVIQTGTNEFQHFFVKNGKVIQRAKSSTGAYRDTAVTGSTGFAQLPVAVVDHAGGRVSLAAVKNNGKVYFTSKTSANGTWKAFQDLGGNMPSGIAVVPYTRDDAVGIYGVSGGQLSYRGQVTFDGAFSPWENLGGSELSGRPTGDSFSLNRGAQLTIRQGGGAVVYQHFADAPEGSRFLNRGGTLAGNHLVSTRDARLGTRLFGTTPDGQVVTSSFYSLEWTSLNSPKTSLPPAATYHGRRDGSDVVIRADDGYLYRTRQVGSSPEFSPWVRVSDSRYGSGATIVVSWDETTGIFFTDQAGATHMCGFDTQGNETGCQVLR